MECTQISVRLIIPLLLLFSLSLQAECYAQQNAREVVTNLYNRDIELVKPDSIKNAIFILATSRSCIKCFNEACTYIAQKYGDDFKVYVVIFMYKNYLDIIPAIQRHQEQISCARDFYFYFTSSTEKEEIKKIEEMPSPQMIVKTGNNYQYLSYKEVIKLIE